MTSSEPDRYARGSDRLAEVDPGGRDAVIASLKDIAPDLATYIVEYPFGDIYSRPGLDLKQRQIATIAMLGALGTATPQLKFHINGGLNVGLTKAEIIEVLIQLSVYAGFPAAINAVTAAKEVFEGRPDAA